MLWKSKQSNKHKIVHCSKISTDPSEDRTLSECSVRRFFELFLDRLIEGLNRAFERCGISKRLASESVELNKNPRRDGFTPNKNQIRKIQQIYSEDFDIYENAWNGAASA